MLTNNYIRTSIGLFFLFVSLMATVQAEEKIEFAVIDRFTIGGEGRWDYLTLDTRQQRLFISRSTHVQVMDLASKKVIGDIPNTSGVHGIALAQDLNRGFTSNGKDNSVTVFDLTSFATIATIKISGIDPDSILYDPTTKRIFTFNGDSANISVIDAQLLKETNTIALAGTPETAVLDGKGKIFVNIENKNKISVIDIVSNKIENNFLIGAGDAPAGLAIDTKNNRLFATCANKKMIVLDSLTGKLLANIDIDSGTDAAAFDPELGVAFSSNGSGTLTVVKENDSEHFSLVQNLVTQKGARTMTYDVATHSAYLITAEFDKAPAATKDNPKPRPAIIANSFVLLKVGLKH